MMPTVEPRCSSQYRLEYLRATCSHNDYTANRDMHILYKRVFIDEKNKILFCAIPKTGISSWKILMMQMSSGHHDLPEDAHNLTVLARHGIRALITLQSLQAIKSILKNYYKVIGVRHPFVRLLSAYKNKFFDRIYSQQHSKHIIRHFRTDNVSDSSVYADRPTWDEFVRFVVAHEYRQADKHWMRYVNLCQPCLIKYDAIIKLETIEEDAREFVSNMKPRGNFSIGHHNPSVGNKDKPFLEYMSELSPDSIQGLRKFYGIDMDMFGYDLGENNNPVCQYSKDKDYNYGDITNQTLMNYGHTTCC